MRGILSQPWTAGSVTSVGALVWQERDVGVIQSLLLGSTVQNSQQGRFD